MPAPQVSVVLPTRNRSAMLMKSVRSALDQDGIGLEVIVVDDGSSDDTAVQLARIDDQRLTVLRNDQPQGVARARNEAIERARGEWIAFLDDDDLWAPGYLRAQLATAAEQELSLCYSGRIEIDERGDVINNAYCPQPRRLARRLLANNAIGGPTGVIVRADLLARIGRFDERLSGLADWDLWIRAARVGRAGACAEPLVAYRNHPTRMMVTDAAEIMAEFELLREKHAQAAMAAGMEFGATWLGRWTAACNLAAGHRLKAAAGYLGSALRERSGRDLARAAGALGGGRLQRLGRSAEARVTARPEWLDRYA
jgi:glycosyltransferase involved in cell wall biosynthesis